MKKGVEIFVGIDISKAGLDMAIHEQAEVWCTRHRLAWVSLFPILFPNASLPYHLRNRQSTGPLPKVCHTVPV